MDKNENVPDWLIPSKVYDALKWVGLVVCPSLAVLTSVVLPIWSIGSATEVVATINAVGVFVGAVIGASEIHAKSGGGADD